MDFGKDDYMSLKLIGTVFVIISCGACGFCIASQYIQKLKQLENIIHMLYYMENELEYQNSSLPVLCRQCAKHSAGQISAVFLLLSNEMEQQFKPDVFQCMQVVLDKICIQDAFIRETFRDLGKNLGGFHAGGQVSSLQRIRKNCEQELYNMKANKNNCVRSYQTLGLCAGAAIAILLV